MNLAPIYIVRRFFYYVLNFFHHWYFHGSRNLAHYFLSVFESADKTFAVKITLKYFFQPLYKDYSVVGRILGVIFRTVRILMGLTVYLFLGAVFLAVYLAWVLFLPGLIVYIIFNI
ncbi:MAG: hypothetical protein AAB787_00005 [Patescibacteria group bacterium]